MATEIAPITSWTLMEEIPIPQDIGPILVQGERPITAFKTFRDSAIFTDRRMIVRDAQGLRGKKVELGRDIDIRRLDQLIAHAVFGQL